MFGGNNQGSKPFGNQGGGGGLFNQNQGMMKTPNNLFSGSSIMGKPGMMGGNTMQMKTNPLNSGGMFGNNKPNQGIGIFSNDMGNSKA